MAKIIKKSEEKVSETFKCPFCNTIFGIKAEDIKVDRKSKYESGFHRYETGTTKCPHCTCESQITLSQCSNPYVRQGFYDRITHVVQNPD